MSKIIEAKAVISAEDRTGKVLDGIARKFRDVGKGAKVSAEVERMNRSLAQTEKGMRSIERINAAQAKVEAAKLSRTGAEAEAARIRSALDQARKVENGRAVADLSAQHRTAERAVTEATAAVQRQERAVRTARQELNALGVPVTNLAAHERALKQSHDATTASIEKLTRAERERERFASDRAAAVERRYGKGSAYERSRVNGGHAHESRRRDQPDGPAVGGGGVGSALGAGAVARFGVAAAGLGGAAYMIGDGFRRAAKSSMDFERTMIEVAKATDASGPTLEKYSEGLLALARTTGKSKEDLGSMLSSAGFAGRPKEELMDFTEYAAKATVAWQTGAEDTGQALAEIGNIYQANQKRIEEIGDAINTMADNSASKETDLLEFMRRAGASSKGAGISAEEMLAFGASMKEVGVRTETAGTAFEAMLNVMKLGEEFSKSAGKGLEELGVKSTKMRKEFVAKPVETMVGLLQKLDKVADPLKKAEIMTNLFGKEYQDDVAKLLNQLPKINEYIGIMRDKSKIAAGGVRFQFGQNLDKDVSKIDRATQSLDVLYKRLGDPIKSKAGGIAEEVNTLVDRLEKGDTILQRLTKRLNGGETSKPIEPPQLNGEGTAEQWFEKNLPFLSGNKWNDWIDGKIGKTGDDTDRMNRADIEARKASERAAVISRTEGAPAEIETQLTRRKALLDRSQAVAGGPAGPQRDLAIAQVTKSTAEIARLEGELAKAWEAIGALRVQQKKDGGAFSPEGPSGAEQTKIGRSNFGLGPNGTDAPQSPPGPRAVPLPPRRPRRFGPSSTVEADLQPESAPQVGTSSLDAASQKATDTRQKIEEIGTVNVSPQIGTGGLDALAAKAREVLALLGQIPGAAATAGNSALGGIRARASSASFSDGVTPGAGGP